MCFTCIFIYCSVKVSMFDKSRLLSVLLLLLSLLLLFETTKEMQQTKITETIEVNKNPRNIYIISI